VPRIPLLISAIALGNLLVPLNSTMIVVALPQISRDLTADRPSVSWLVTGYLIAMASLQPIGGRVGDRFGRREIMQGALVLFALASIGAALAQSLVLLVAFRLLQAVAACAIVPNALGLLRGSLVGSRSGLYFGIAGSMTGLGAAVGPVLGGFLATFDWRWIFAVNVPIVAVTLGLGWRSLPYAAPRRTAPPDVVGALSLGALLGLLAWTLIDSEKGLDPLHAALLLVVAAGAVLFVRYESAHPDAALPPALFRSRVFTGANLTVALSNVALYGTFLALPIALAHDPGGAVRSGIVLTAMSAGLVLLPPLSGALVDRFGGRVPTALGGLLIGVGLSIPVITGRPTDFALLLIAMPIAGAGIGMNFPATRIAALDAAPEHLVALASGVTSTSRYLGGIVGALLTAIVLGSSDDLSRLQLLFTIFALAGLGAALVGGMMLAPHRHREAVAPPMISAP